MLKKVNNYRAKIEEQLEKFSNDELENNFEKICLTILKKQKKGKNIQIEPYLPFENTLLFVNYYTLYDFKKAYNSLLAQPFAKSEYVKDYFFENYINRIKENKKYNSIYTDLKRGGDGIVGIHYNNYDIFNAYKDKLAVSEIIKFEDYLMKLSAVNL